MPVVICQGCGKRTNTASSKFNRVNPPLVCYAAYDDDNKWVKGCGYEDAPSFEKEFDRHLITDTPMRH